MARMDGEQSSGELINLGFLEVLSILETGEMLAEWELLSWAHAVLIWAFFNVKFQQNSG